MNRSPDKYAVGEVVALCRELRTIGGTIYPAGALFIVTRRRPKGYTAREVAGEHRWIRDVNESRFRELTDDERVAQGLP